MTIVYILYPVDEKYSKVFMKMFKIISDSAFINSLYHLFRKKV